MSENGINRHGKLPPEALVGEMRGGRFARGSRRFWKQKRSRGSREGESRKPIHQTIRSSPQTRDQNCPFMPI